MGSSSICGLVRWHPSVNGLEHNNFQKVAQATTVGGSPVRASRIVSTPRRLLLSVPAETVTSNVLGRSILAFPPPHDFSLACQASEVAMDTSWDVDVHTDESSPPQTLLWIAGEEQISNESGFRRDQQPHSTIYADRLLDETVKHPYDIPSAEMSNRGSPVRIDPSHAQLDQQVGVSEHLASFSTHDNASSVLEAEVHGSTGMKGSLKDIDGVNLSSGKLHADRREFREFSVGNLPAINYGAQGDLKYARELEVAVKAVQLSCILSQRVQQRVLKNLEKTDFKKDRSLVTIADWGVQAVVSWILTQAFQGEAIPMIAEEDTTGLRGMEKIDLLQRVVAVVNECLQDAGIVGVSPPARPLGAIDVLKAINKGSANGGPKGRYWVLDPVDGTLGFVRGDQYAIALALIEDGEVVLAVLGCPNFPLRKQWLVHHHRYYRVAARLHPPSASNWHKGLILSTTKGAGKVIMQPLVVDADGSPQKDVTWHMARPVSVSPIDDPSKATFCEPFEKANSSHSFTAGLAEQLGLRNRPLRVYSMAKYAAIARGDAEIFMKFAKAGYQEKIWDHAAGVLIVQEAGGVVTDAGGKALDFSQGRFLENLDRGIIACSGKTLHEKLLKAVDASWNSSTL